MKKTIIVIGAGQRGAFAYVPYALDNGDQLQVVGVAEPVEVKREYMCATYGISKENAYTYARKFS
jgi:predicted dehydrogenase